MSNKRFYRFMLAWFIFFLFFALAATATTGVSEEWLGIHLPFRPNLIVGPIGICLCVLKLRRQKHGR